MPQTALGSGSHPDLGGEPDLMQPRRTRKWVATSATDKSRYW